MMVTADGLSECWCCGSLHDAIGGLCPGCDDAGCKHFGGECQSDHIPVTVGDDP